jgi:uncharacterized protein DUF1207
MAAPSRSARLAAAAAAVALASPAVASDGATAEPPPLRCGTGVHPAEGSGFVWFPQGQVFCPLLADPKQVRTFASYLRGEFPSISASKRDVGSVGIGDTVRFFRNGGPSPGEGVQLGLDAAVFAQFNLDAPSADLINADYTFGIPLTFRRGPVSGRVRLYHQSSHLGDEYLAHSTDVVNQGLSFESVDMVLSGDLGPLRIYAGGEYLFDRHPSTLDPYVAHAGTELHVGPPRGVHFVAALDVKASQQRDWDPAWSARAGIEIAHWSSPDHPPRVWSVLGEYYDGPSPYGQFFLDQTRFYGFGFHFLL